MTVLDCLKPLSLSTVGNDDRMLRNKFVVVCKCPGTLLIVKCPAPRLIVKQMPGVSCPEVGTDSHITQIRKFEYYVCLLEQRTGIFVKFRKGYDSDGSFL